VLAAAIRLADESGIESRSMRNLGQELCVEAMSLYNHVSFTLQAQSFPIETKEELQKLAAEFLQDFPVDEYPFLTEHIRQHVDPGESDEGAFAFGLDLILDGLERLRDA
jgi:tetracycline repressor-like protein